MPHYPSRFLSVLVAALPLALGACNEPSVSPLAPTRPQLSAVKF